MGSQARLTTKMERPEFMEKVPTMPKVTTKAVVVKKSVTTGKSACGECGKRVVLKRGVRAFSSSCICEDCYIAQEKANPMKKCVKCQCLAPLKIYDEGAKMCFTCRDK